MWTKTVGCTPATLPDGCRRQCHHQRTQQEYAPRSKRQNIYPEEIEDKLNNLPYVAESIIVQQNEKLVGLVYPDFDDAFAHGLNNDDIERVMEENRVALNAELPAYSQISKMKIYPEEFEKTPKNLSNASCIRKQKDDEIVISG